MTLKNYFEKTGKIYGISTKYNFGHWDYYIKAFDDLDAAYNGTTPKNTTLELANSAVKHTLQKSQASPHSK